MAESPLSKVTKDSLQMLFNKNPKDMTDGEVEEICKKLREQRTAFMLEEAKPKRSKIKADPNLSLEDLDI